MPSNPPGGRTPAQRQTDHASLVHLSETLVPALVQKLAVSGLGELEVREGDWRIRLRRPIAPIAPTTRRADRPRLGAHAEREGRSVSDGATGGQRGHAVSDAAHDTRLGAADVMPESPAQATATSPAVGVFRSGPGIGTAVRAGDAIGVVDLLGIPQDVPAPIDGTLIEVFPESGEAVEYGEAIGTVEAATPRAEAAADGSATATRSAPAGEPEPGAPTTPAVEPGPEASSAAGDPAPDEAPSGAGDPEPGAGAQA